jgi:hypothetical protein
MNPAVDHTREFPFSPEHFRVITDRIYRVSGIKLPEAKREMVYARLARRLRSLGLASFDDYVRYLEAEPSEWEHCTNALTTNVTPARSITSACSPSMPRHGRAKAAPIASGARGAPRERSPTASR